METTEFINALKQEWDRIEDKYTVMTLAATASLRMWSRRSCIGRY
jgi:AAA+ superfamily predicted ATPase